ncbi:MAG: hypothetical protein O4861_03990 [Trichodesmium sp. St16_bin4-tuft]|nr:hypothetical protein [Trichodesmium sp. MAG_R01]MDE5069593.1 hypothetical protein [Trichodesmium sp. St4_bin8_1]MDE5070409.1 hypothetical protein [Trichodesmium sp. St5_bin8]MDE5078540.1 hypothetical protein [Trichodesmium sp. St2_bin6]MDE5097544.1 hypothetical protein [Trichodesmium sp. St16_bin4-tuft]MDE5104724.1 hypothetical protein [Trichodesmium sp. St19_bin2]
MASHDQVRKYIAYWFQLGKKMLTRNGQESFVPQVILSGDRYTQEFEECWQKILSSESGDCYLEGTNQTTEELLSPQWDICPCARCSMPIPFHVKGMPPECCPCFDLPNWPDTETPLPRAPISSKLYLLSICERLLSGKKKENVDTYHHNSHHEKLKLY